MYGFFNYKVVHLYDVFEIFVDMTNCRSTCQTQRCSSGPLMESTSSRPQLRHDCASTTATDSGTIRARWSTRRRSIRQRRNSGRSVQSLLLCFLWTEYFCKWIQLSVFILSASCLSFCNFYLPVPLFDSICLFPPLHVIWIKTIKMHFQVAFCPNPSYQKFEVRELTKYDRLQSGLPIKKKVCMHILHILHSNELRSLKYRHIYLSSWKYDRF